MHAHGIAAARDVIAHDTILSFQRTATMLCLMLAPDDASSDGPGDATMGAQGRSVGGTYGGDWVQDHILFQL